MRRLYSLLTCILGLSFVTQTWAARFTLTVKGPGHLDNFQIVLEGYDEFGDDSEEVYLFDDSSIADTTIVRTFDLNPEKLWDLMFTSGEIYADDKPCSVSLECNNCSFSVSQGYDVFGNAGDFLGLSGDFPIPYGDIDISLVVNIEKREDLVPVNFSWMPKDHIRWNLDMDGSLFIVRNGFVGDPEYISAEIDFEEDYQMWNGEETMPDLYVQLGGEISIYASYSLYDSSLYNSLPFNFVIEANGTKYPGDETCVLDQLDDTLNVSFRLDVDDSDRYVDLAAEGGGSINMTFSNLVDDEPIFSSTIPVRDSILHFDLYPALSDPDAGINRVDDITIIPDDCCKVVGLTSGSEDLLGKYLKNQFNPLDYKQLKVVFGADSIPFVIANDTVRVYGDEIEQYAWSVFGDSIQGEPLLVTEATVASPVGTYPIKVEPGTIQGDFVPVAGTLTIEKAPLTVIADEIVVYVNEEIPELTMSFEGFRNDDDEGVFEELPMLSIPDDIDLSVEGTYPITVSGGSAHDYEFSYQPGNLIVVVPIPITFNDEAARDVCLANWDLNGDSILIEFEAKRVTSLGHAFTNDSTVISFDELRFFTSLTEIADSAFMNCVNLQSVTLPETVTALGRESFAGCTSLQTFHFPAAVNTIGDMALGGCSSINSFTVDSLSTEFTTVDGVLFSKDEKTLVLYPLAKGNQYVVPDGTTTIGNYAFYKSMIDEILFPTTLRTISDYAFAMSESLPNVVLPRGFTTLRSHAFDSCKNLKIFTFPSSVKGFGLYTFAGCDALTDVYSEIISPLDLDPDYFTPTAFANAVLRVPADSKVIYMFTNGWKKFAHISGEAVALEVTGLDLYADETVQIPVSLYNYDLPVTNYQFNVTLPEGFTIAADEEGNLIYTLSDRYGNPVDRKLSFTQTDVQTYHVEWQSVSGSPLQGSEGIFITLTIMSGSELERGKYKGSITDFTTTRTNGSVLKSDNQVFTLNLLRFDNGDVNHDDLVNVADVMLIVGNIFGNTSPKFHQDCADVNGDGNIDVADVMGVVNIILSAPLETISQTAVSPDHLSVYSDGSDFTISMENTSHYNACQMDVQVPAGGMLSNVDLCDGVGTGHTLKVSDHGDGLYRIVVYNTNGTAFHDNNSGLLHFHVDGTSEVSVSGVQFCNSDFETISVSDVSSSIDGLGEIEKTGSDDAVYTIQGVKVKTPQRGINIKNGRKYSKK